MRVTARPKLLKRGFPKFLSHASARSVVPLNITCTLIAPCCQSRRDDCGSIEVLDFPDCSILHCSSETRPCRNLFSLATMNVQMPHHSSTWAAEMIEQRLRPRTPFRSFG